MSANKRAGLPVGRSGKSPRRNGPGSLELVDEFAWILEDTADFIADAPLPR